MSVSNLSSSSRPGICTSTTRPVNPYSGQTIFETDTSRILTWSGSAWVGVSSLAGLQIDGSGRVTMPLQPAFRYHGWTITSSGMQGGTAPLNIGSGLTIGSGATYSKFTAPVSGTYLVGGTALVDQTGGRVEINFRKNGSQTIDGYSAYAINQYTNATGAYSNVSGTFIFYLSAGDYVDMIQGSGTLFGDLGRGDRAFYGYLIG